MSTPQCSPTSSAASSMSNYKSAVGFDSDSSCSSTSTIRNYQDAPEMDYLMIRQVAKRTSSSSSDDSIELLDRTLFREQKDKEYERPKEKERYSSFYRFSKGSESDSDSISALCDKFDGTHLNIAPKQQQKENKEVPPTPLADRSSVPDLIDHAHSSNILASGDTERTTTTDANDQITSSVQHVVSTLSAKCEAGMSSDHSADLTVDPNIEHTFVDEAQQRSNARHEGACNDFDHTSAEKEPIEASGGCMPKKTHHVSWMTPPVSVHFSPSSTMSLPATPSFSPNQMGVLFNMDEMIINNEEDLRQFQQMPKDVFLKLLNRFMATFPVNQIYARQCAVTFVTQLVFKYRNIDQIRYDCFAHLLHTNIEPYCYALYFLYSMQNSAQYSLLENLYIRAIELDKAVELCESCLSANQ